MVAAPDKVSDVYKRILGMIRDGSFPVSEKIMPETELAGKFGVSKSSVNRAIKKMVERGIVIRDRSGTVVARRVTDDDFEKPRKSSEKNVFVIYTLQEDSNLHWGETSLLALESILKEKGYSLIFREIETSITEKNFFALIKGIMEQSPEAIIISAGGYAVSHHIDNLKSVLCEMEVPLFLHDRPGTILNHLPFHSIALDPFRDGMTIGRLLRKTKAGEVYFLMSQSFKQYQWPILRYEGVKAGLTNGQPEPVNVPLLDTNIDLFDKITDSKGKPVVITLNNVIAATFIDKAREKGLKIPRDFQVISFDDHPAWFSYNISSLRTPQEKIGKLFAQLICNKSALVENGNTLSVKVNSEYVERQTFKAG